MNGRGEVLPDWKIKELIKEGVIPGADESLVNPSSLDLRVGLNKYKLLGSFLPLENQSLRQALKSPDIVDDKNTSSNNFYLEPDQPYLMELVERLDLPDSVSARIHNKSGRGRIGTSVKGLAEKVLGFNEIPRGYKGKLYAEICATAFPTVIRPGDDAIPQIVFYNGAPQPLRGLDLDLLLRNHPILTDSNGRPAYSRSERKEIMETGKFTFHADLSDELMIYKAKRDRRTIILSEKNRDEPYDFFEEVRKRHSDDKSVVIHPGEFVLIKSKEHIRLPKTVSAEISDYSPDLGDLKSHYAGMVNAGHGFDRENPNVPSHIVFEVRARDIPVLMQDGQRLAKFEVYRMLGEPEQSYMANRSTDYSDLKSILPRNFKK